MAGRLTPDEIEEARCTLALVRADGEAMRWPALAGVLEGLLVAVLSESATSRDRQRAWAFLTVLHGG